MISRWAASQRDLTSPPHGDEAPRPMSSAYVLGVSAVVISLAFLTAGIVWPQAAETLLRTLVVTLAVTTVVVHAFRTLLPVHAAGEISTPFDGSVGGWTLSAAPHPLRRLTDELKAADDARAAPRTPVPMSVRLIIRDEAARRLSERHGLNLGDPTHHARIQSLVAEPTWRLLRSADPRVRSGPEAVPPTRIVPLSQLDHILTDLERL
jgi:hypothetical protein